MHLISEVLPSHEGIPSDIPVTARYRVEGRQNECVYAPATGAALTEFGPAKLRSRESAFRKWNGIFSLPTLDNNLFDYAGISVASYQFPLAVGRTRPFKFRKHSQKNS